MTELSIDVTQLSDLILEKLRESGQWMTRREIAQAMGRPGNRLNPYDVQLLEVLASQKLVEIAQRKIGIVQTENIYRAK